MSDDGRRPDEAGASGRRIVELPVVAGAPGREAASSCAPRHDPAGALPMDRRQALKVMAIAAAAPTLAQCAPGEEATELATPSPPTNPMAAGTAWDPDLVAPVVPWERTLAADELESLAALCDVILPADDRSPSASALSDHPLPKSAPPATTTAYTSLVRPRISAAAMPSASSTARSNRPPSSSGRMVATWFSTSSVTGDIDSSSAEGRERTDRAIRASMRR